jgi:CDP-paratose 2-epimerase
MSVNRNNARPPQGRKIGLLQWFHAGDHERAERTIEELQRAGIEHLRTGISWADHHTPEGVDWYKWLMPKLGRHFDLLPCFLYTPPSLGIAYKTSSPPRSPKSYADFIDHFVSRYGRWFDWVELWNEPNNRSEYDYTVDVNWNIFCEMISMSSYWAKQLGKRTALGGMSPMDPNWLDMMAARGALTNIDAVGIHGFPGSFDPGELDWNTKVDQVRRILHHHRKEAEVWITEAGFSTWQYDEKRQVVEFLKAIGSDADRVYWYSLFDLSPDQPTVDGFHMDEREYFFGAISHKGQPKLITRFLEQNERRHSCAQPWWRSACEDRPHPAKDHVLITGGAGFIGINLADELLSQGHRVIIYDNLSRQGVERNMNWLLEKHGRERIWFMLADVRNGHLLRHAVAHSSSVFHLAAQVAVTTSLTDPGMDLDVNVRGTFNLLEAIRESAHQPPLVFTSTNKVYGDLEHVEFAELESRYQPVEASIRDKGISEALPLVFHSPYGNSKGSAEQYVLDYARSYGLRTCVFRMSCIYGPNQHGTEDQGWVAHFAINLIQGEPLHFYGNGKQVRDILYVTDLVEAFKLAQENMDHISGQAFNIGGGPSNTVSLIELVHMLELENDVQAQVHRHAPRVGDQVYYVSDTSKFTTATGWRPTVTRTEGLRRLWAWQQRHHAASPVLKQQRTTA